MNIIVVLSHLMDADGSLGQDTLLRANRAIQLFETLDCQLLITTGWAYRDDSSIPIGNAVKRYVRANSTITESQIETDSRSRDTVGDAFFLRQRIAKRSVNKVYIVTSDYHVKRTGVIFSAFFPNLCHEVIGCETEKYQRNSIMKHEEASTKAFFDTFLGVDCASDDAVICALKTKHPFYNGEIFPSIICDN